MGFLCVAFVLSLCVHDLFFFFCGGGGGGGVGTREAVPSDCGFTFFNQQSIKNSRQSLLKTTTKQTNKQTAENSLRCRFDLL